MALNVTLKNPGGAVIDQLADQVPIFVINMDRRNDRLDLISRRMKKINVQWERVPAIDGSNPEHNDKVDWKKFRYYTQFLPNQRGAIGCYLSHRSIWQKMVDQNIERALILEDDVAPSSSWSAEILGIDIGALGLDNLRLESRSIGPMPHAEYFQVQVGPWLAKNLHSWGGGAYILTRLGAAKCLRMEKMWFMADDFFMMNRILNLRTALLFPSMWVHMEETPSDNPLPKNRNFPFGFARRIFADCVTLCLREFERYRFRQLESRGTACRAP